MTKKVRQEGRNLDRQIRGRCHSHTFIIFESRMFLLCTKIKNVPVNIECSRPTYCTVLGLSQGAKKFWLSFACSDSGYFGECSNVWIKLKGIRGPFH